MKAPGLVPSVETRDRLVVLPEAKPRRRWLKVAGVILLAAWTAAVSGIGVYLWQRDKVHDRDTVIAQSRADNADLTSNLAGVNARVTGLEAAIATTRSQLDQAQIGLDLYRNRSNQEIGHAGVLQGKLTEQMDALLAVTGPRLHHGMHIGYIAGVNATESRMVLDLGRWFTGPEARQAALADGAIATGEPLPGARYLRNPDHSWRIVHVRFGTTITLRHYLGADGPTTVSLTTLQTIFDTPGTAANTVRLDPFWVFVEDGEITSITQQQYVAP